MNPNSLRRLISVERLSPYLKKNNQNFDKALEHYQSNIRISEAFYPLISILEIGLRNNINKQLSQLFHNPEWYNSTEYLSISTHFHQKKIADAKMALNQSKKAHNSGRIISELTFGYWTSLFDKRYESELWKSLRLAFPNCEKSIRKRKTISSKLNRARKFRNRIFHHEPISWNFDVLLEYNNDIEDVINWLDPEFLEWSSNVSRIKEVLIIERSRNR